MTITRAKKTSAKAPRAPITVEQFIDGAGNGAEKDAAAPAPDREARALAIMHRHLPWAAGAGLLPMPVVDIFIISGVQFRMLAKMCDEYGVPFREEALRATVATSVTSLMQYAFSGNVAAAAVKFVPIAGPLLGVAMLPSFAAATTYALAKVYIMHFESGGTLLDFDPKKVEAHFRAEFDRARSGAVSPG